MAATGEIGIVPAPKEQPPRKLSGKRTVGLAISGKRQPRKAVRRRDNTLRQTNRWGARLSVGLERPNEYRLSNPQNSRSDWEDQRRFSRCFRPSTRRTFAS